MFIKTKYYLISIVLIFIFSYVSVLYLNKFEKVNFIKNSIGEEKLYAIKYYFFPWKTIESQKQIIEHQTRVIKRKNRLLEPLYIDALKLEYAFKASKKSVLVEKSNDVDLLKGLKLKKYKITEGLYAGINNLYPGSGYIDFYGDKFIILSSRGIILISDEFGNKTIFKQIDNNLNNFANFNNFKKKEWFSFKDIKIIRENIFISYTEEIKPNCWNTSVVFGKMNVQKIEFKKLFSAKELLNTKTCTHSLQEIGDKFTPDNVDREFNAHQSGGRIVEYNENHILLTVGDYRNRERAQMKDTFNGKIFKINITNSDYEIVSLGHRNPQGLYFDRENNYLVQTEHGPQHADEINLIDLNKFNNNEELNYGWPISSYGLHWDGGLIDGKFLVTKEGTKIKYKKYPLYKSHKEHGFIEPLKQYTPSIGISEIVRVGKKKYVHSSLKDRSLYFFDLNEENNLINLERVEVFERIRDLIIKDNKLYLLLEDTASIGIIDLN